MRVRTLLSALLASTIVSGVVSAQTVPGPAAAAGYNTLTYSGTVLGNTFNPVTGLPEPNVPKGATLYPFTFFFTAWLGIGLTQNPDGSITMDGSGQQYGNGLSTAIVGSSTNPTADNFLGQAFGGGGYFEVTMRGSTHTQFSFWANDIESLNGGSLGLGQVHWPGQPAGYGNWFEPDIAEFDVDNFYAWAFHNWYNSSASGDDISATFGGPIIGTGGCGHGPQGPFTPPPGVDYTQNQKYAALWIPATKTTPGSMQYYFNGNPVGNHFQWEYWDPANPPAPPPTPGAFSGGETNPCVGNGSTGGTYAPGTGWSGIDTRHLAFTMGSNPGTTMTLSSFSVWQASGANDLPVINTSASPTITAPATLAATAGSTTPVPGVSMVDSANPSDTQTFTITSTGSGKLTATGTTNNGTSSLSYSGSVAAVNTMLGTLSFQDPVVENATITLFTTDQHSLTGTATIAAAVTGVTIVETTNNTIVPSGASTSITDANGNVWTVPTANGQVFLNGAAILASASVAEIAYVNGVVWQLVGSNWSYFQVSSGGLTAACAATISPVFAFSPIQTNWWSNPGQDGWYWKLPFQTTATWTTTGSGITWLRNGFNYTTNAEGTQPFASANLIGNFGVPFYYDTLTNDVPVTVKDSGTGTSWTVHLPPGSQVESPVTGVDSSIGGTDAAQPGLMWNISNASITVNGTAANAVGAAGTATIITGTYCGQIDWGFGPVMVDAVTGQRGCGNSYGGIMDTELSLANANPSYVIPHMLQCTLDIHQVNTSIVWPLSIADGGAVYTGPLSQGQTLGIPASQTRPAGMTRGQAVMFDTFQQMGCLVYNFGATGGMNISIYSTNPANSALVTDIVNNAISGGGPGGSSWLMQYMSVLNNQTGVSSQKGEVGGVRSDAFTAPPLLSLRPTGGVEVSSATVGAYYPTTISPYSTGYTAPAPLIVAPATLAAVQSVTKSIPGVIVNEIWYPNDTLTVTVTSSGSGVFTMTGATGSGSGVVTFTGTPAQVNSALGTLIFEDNTIETPTVYYTIYDQHSEIDTATTDTQVASSTFGTLPPDCASTTNCTGAALPSGYLSSAGAQFQVAGRNVRLACAVYHGPNTASDYSAIRAAGFNCARFDWIDSYIVAAPAANGTASANGTVESPGAGWFTDGTNIFTIVVAGTAGADQVYENGTGLSGAENTKAGAWCNGQSLFQDATSGTWYIWTGSTFTATTAPTCAAIGPLPIPPATIPAGCNSLTQIQSCVTNAAAAGLAVVFNHLGNEVPAAGSACVKRQQNGLWFDQGTDSGGADGCGDVGTVSAATFQADTVKLLQTFSGNTTVVGYELHNEPVVTGTFTGTGSPAIPVVNWGGGGPTDIEAACGTVGAAVAAVNSGVVLFCPAPVNNSGTTLLNGTTSKTFGTTVSNNMPDLSGVTAHPVTGLPTGKLAYSVHLLPANVGSSTPDTPLATVTPIWQAYFGYLESGGIAPVANLSTGCSCDGSNGALADDQAFMTAWTTYANGLASGGPAFSGTQKPMSTAWLLWGQQSGSNPNGVLNADNSLKGTESGQSNGQAWWWSQMLESPISAAVGRPYVMIWP